METQSIKQRFAIIGSSKKLTLAIEKASQVAQTDISVLITGESGTGKESMPKIIHSLSPRKHNQYIAVNCGAIPEGTIDSELFGHEKGAFTGAIDSRKGYFEVATGGTIFLDEVAELPISTQVRLLRILETGEFIRVGSSKVQKTDIRIVAATNINIGEAISKGKFREDLYYRLNTVEINMPSLRKRPEDIHLLFRKFAADFSDRYKVPPIRLEEEAVKFITKYQWPGNIRQLKNFVEQISVMEENRTLSKDILVNYLPKTEQKNKLVLYNKKEDEKSFASEREILYKILFDMRNDINDLKSLTKKLTDNEINIKEFNDNNETEQLSYDRSIIQIQEEIRHANEENNIIAKVENLSLQDKEIELIKKALEKHQGKRKKAAKELQISERTLYRKIKQYNL